ncbi:MAG: DedA family protein [Pseudomonadota bacterium]
MHNPSEHFANLVESYGFIILFPTIFLETFGVPLPGESALIATSVMAAKGALNIYAVAVVAILAAIAGDNVAYFIGRRYGRSIILAYGTRFGITEARYDTVEQLAQKYGAFIVVFARFFVLLRQLNGLVAGSASMPWAKFFIANVLGSVFWVVFWTTLAYQFGEHVSLLPKAVHHALLIAAMAIPVVLVLMFVFGRNALKKRTQTAGTRSD